MIRATQSRLIDACRKDDVYEDIRNLCKKLERRPEDRAIHIILSDWMSDYEDDMGRELSSEYDVAGNKVYKPETHGEDD